MQLVITMFDDIFFLHTIIQNYHLMYLNVLGQSPVILHLHLHLRFLIRDADANAGQWPSHRAIP